MYYLLWSCESLSEDHLLMPIRASIWNLCCVLCSRDLYVQSYRMGPCPLSSCPSAGLILRLELVSSRGSWEGKDRALLRDPSHGNHVYTHCIWGSPSEWKLPLGELQLQPESSRVFTPPSFRSLTWYGCAAKLQWHTWLYLMSMTGTSIARF